MELKEILADLERSCDFQDVAFLYKKSGVILQNNCGCQIHDHVALKNKKIVIRYDKGGESEEGDYDYVPLRYLNFLSQSKISKALDIIEIPSLGVPGEGYEALDTRRDLVSSPSFLQLIRYQVYKKLLNQIPSVSYVRFSILNQSPSLERFKDFEVPPSFVDGESYTNRFVFKQHCARTVTLTFSVYSGVCPR